MSEQTAQLQNKASEALLTMLDITVKSMGDVVEWGSQQIPEGIHQLLMWRL